ncbi:MAG: hypothetical protein LBS72_10430 [Oscillospiraceae bacterium]|jgi:hypothetical protein|nr:hypothetical protein [Oscillospiraceae bacterium]
MYSVRTKWIQLVALLLAALIALSGCGMRGGEDDVEQDAIDTEPVSADLPLKNDPTPTPTHVPEQTITPRPVGEAVETPAPNSTPTLIDPIDKPKPTFAFAEYSSASLGISFNVPETWQQISQDDQTMLFTEPESEALDGYAAMLRVTVMHQSADLESDDAIASVDTMRDSLKEEFPGIEISSRGDRNRMLNEYGYYYNYRIPVEGGKPVRGRIFALAVNRMMIQIELRCPALYNEDYMEIFREVRNSAEIYTGDEE